jgi:hypothetical protein
MFTVRTTVGLASRQRTPTTVRVRCPLKITRRTAQDGRATALSSTAMTLFSKDSFPRSLLGKLLRNTSLSEVNSSLATGYSKPRRIVCQSGAKLEHIVSPHTVSGPWEICVIGLKPRTATLLPRVELCQPLSGVRRS